MASPGVALDTSLLTMVNFYSQFKATPHIAPVNLSTVPKKGVHINVPALNGPNKRAIMNSRLIEMSYWPDLGSYRRLFARLECVVAFRLKHRSSICNEATRAALLDTML